MPRRIYTYEPGRGWEIWNLIVTIGVVFQAAGILVFAANLIWSYFRGKRAGNDPWDAWTLEWSHKFAAAGIQLRQSSQRAQPPAAMGSKASGRSRLEVRVAHERTICECPRQSRVAPSVARTRWDVLPDRS